MVTFAIIVTFYPNYKVLKDCLFSIINQVDKVLIVKNSQETNPFNYDNVETIQLEHNFGIAYAQNIGIKTALSRNAKFILFSDQDTVYPSDYISRMKYAFEMYSPRVKTAAIVPLFYNENKQQVSLIMPTKNNAIQANPNNVHYLAHSISSGSFCPTDALKKVGLMNERLFIDWVDNEWCWRALRMDYKIICDPAIVINHSLGDKYKVFFGRKIVVYSNFRSYFFFRNAFYLLFHSSLLSITDSILFAKNLVIKMIVFFITSGFSFESCKLIGRAAYKGISNNFTLEEEVK